MTCGRPNDPENLDEVTALINEAAADPSTDIEYMRHAQERCLQRHINPGFVQKRILMRGRAVSFEFEDLENRRRIYKYRFCYEDHECHCCAIVRIVLNGSIYIITVFHRAKHRK